MANVGAKMKQKIKVGWKREPTMIFQGSKEEKEGPNTAGRIGGQANKNARRAGLRRKTRSVGGTVVELRWNCGGTVVELCWWWKGVQKPAKIAF